jgi:hypothetical protein
MDAFSLWIFLSFWSRLAFTFSSFLHNLHKPHYECIFEPRHDKTNVMRLRPAWIQTSLPISAVWLGSMLFAISYSICNRVCKRGSWSDWVDAQAGLDPCWLQTYYVGFVMMRLISWIGQILLSMLWKYHWYIKKYASVIKN